ncbi:hypothetical protein ACLOJK_037408 [Asimina triloba]
MSIVLAFGFMPGGGFALGDCRSFDPAVPYQFIHVLASMARRTYSYVDYSPMAITLATEGNWLTLAVAASLASPSAHKSFHKTVSAVIALSAPRPSRKATIVAAVSSAPRPSRKAATVVAPSSVATSTPRSADKTASAAAAASSVSGRVKKRSRKDAQPMSPGLHYNAPHLGSRRSRRAPTIVLKKKVMVVVKRGDLTLGWCYPPRRHNTYPRLVTDYWVQVRTPNKFGPLIRLSKA